MKPSATLVAACVALAQLLAGCRTSPPVRTEPVPAPTPRPAPVEEVHPVPALLHRVIPAPSSVELAGPDTFALAAASRIVVDAGADSVPLRVAELLAGILRPSTGFTLPVERSTGAAPAASIALRLSGDPRHGAEGYALVVTGDSVLVTAGTAAGLFNGTQTLRQLFAPGIEARQSVVRRRGETGWRVPAMRVSDAPRFAWRGAMLDVARHFFTVHEVKQYIDILAMYKLNVLHLHLSDDQGWRIEIRSRPRLAQLGGATQVGGGPGGWYTQAEYADIVRYAQERFVTVVPEVDMPAHTNAALVAYPELSCGKAPVDRPAWRGPEPYTGIRVGWSALCPDSAGTYALVEDVVRELAALTPGPYVHIGGDEVEALTDSQYVRFIERVQGIVHRHGKRMIGWEEVAQARLHPTSLAQQWRSDSVVRAVRQGARVVLSPAKRMYLDMKYTPETELGLAWAGHVEVRDAYEWDPATHVPGVAERDIAGIEAPIWSETLRNITAVQYLAMPRLPAIAEVAWSAQGMREWEGFRYRLAAHASRWNLLGINWYRSPQVPW